ncbi:Rrf2 family transcriptional regulator [Antrihabitans sp. YC2-6]|uniref:RrF2 family transcriptional regulator n=1 Tax=Antrihabitans sp. YC2-6 TaxID=2799498 RepID=UPI0018F6B860|nr:Rrf2 family transcriptional regulator [Antrihabitans sp. YC2-6]MBJ8347737.1 Rrf2 family transcriptional regulator [Antrihabitans sp. YC2-6]
MRLSDGVEWALHCCVVLRIADAPTPASRLAEFHDVSPSYLAKHLQGLSRAGIIRSVQGKGGGYVLGRPAEEISVLDVVEAVNGAAPSFVCTEIRQRGPCRTPPEKCVAPCGINAVMLSADAAWRNSLRGVTISDLASRADKTAPGDGTGLLAPARKWLAASS